MYQVSVERRAQKLLSKISDPYYSKIKTAILDLTYNPRPSGCKKLKGRNGYRIRIAHYRVVYEIVDTHLIVNVIGIGDRKDVYK